VLSQEHNNSGTLAEMYQIARGCTISKITITANEGDLIRINSDWTASSISDWSPSHDLLTPVFASALTSIPWASTSTGGRPLIFTDLDNKSYDIRNFSCSIDHNIIRRQILDQSYTLRIDPTVRDINIEMDILYQDNDISEIVKTFSSQEIKMQLNFDQGTGQAVTLTFTDLQLEAYDETIDSTSTEAKIVSYSGSAASVLISKETPPGIPVGQTSTHKYNVVGVILASQTSTHKYNIQVFGNFVTNNFDSSNFVLDT
jgi:hypothetical protein